MKTDEIIHVPESGVADCPCCGDHHMVNDIYVPTLCDECVEADCPRTTDGAGDAGYWDCQQIDEEWEDEADGDGRGYDGVFDDRDCSGVYDGVGGVVSDADPGL